MPPALSFVDVSDLEPPEPLDRILSELGTLGTHQVLKVRHRREPHPLYALLEAQGFRHLCRQRGEGDFRIYIWHGEAGDLGPFCMVDLQTEVGKC